MSSAAIQVFPSVQGDQVPAASRQILEKIRKGFGFIPNLLAAFSNSPLLLEGYLGLDAVNSRGTLSVAAVRAGQPVADSKLNALVNLTRELVHGRGPVATATIESFLNAGYHNDQIGEVIIGIALKTMSNYTHHVSPVEIDAAFKAEA